MLDVSPHHEIAQLTLTEVFVMKCLFGLLLAAFFSLSVSAVGTAQEKSSPEEIKFLQDGPRLYTMEKALELSKETGKPVVCWMGKHLFANEAARKLSAELGDTTIQAAMDTDGTEYDKVGFRVKFSTNNYSDNSKVFFVPLARFGEANLAEKILSKARGGR